MPLLIKLSLFPFDSLYLSSFGNHCSYRDELWTYGRLGLNLKILFHSACIFSFLRHHLLQEFPQLGVFFNKFARLLLALTLVLHFCI